MNLIKPQLFTLDLFQFTDQIKPNSIDYIFTDPPYGKQYLEVWRALGKMASIVLKEGGSLFAMGGAYHLPTMLQYLAESLRYHWMCLYAPSDYGMIVWHARIQTSYKPIFWFTKGDYHGSFKSDKFAARQGKIAKNHHWSQSMDAFREMMHQWCDPGSVVYDLCMGGGSVIVAGMLEGFQMIGSDIDPFCLPLTDAKILEFWDSKLSNLGEY